MTPWRWNRTGNKNKIFSGIVAILISDSTSSLKLGKAENLSKIYRSFHILPCLASFSTIIDLWHDFMHYVVFSSLIFGNIFKLFQNFGTSHHRISETWSGVWLLVALIARLLRYAIGPGLLSSNTTMHPLWRIQVSKLEQDLHIDSYSHIKI